MMSDSQPLRRSTWIATRDDVRLVVEEVGDGPPLVLLHGFPETRDAWSAVAADLGRDFRCLMPDQRGCGQSDHPRDGYDMLSLAGDVIAVLNAAGLDEPVPVVGHDIGGMIAVAAALAHPGRISHLGDFEGPPPGLSFEGWTERRAAFWHFDFFATPTAPELLIAGKERKFLSWFIRDYGRVCHRRDLVTTERTDRYADSLAEPGALTAVLGVYRQMAESASQIESLVRSGSRITVPTLAGGGEHCLGEAIGRLLAPIADRCDQMVIANSGHWVAEENPGAVAAAIRRLLESDSESDAASKPVLQDTFGQIFEDGSSS